MYTISPVVTFCNAQVIKGTHKCGRIEHNLEYGQTVANTERVNILKEKFEHVYAEMDPGKSSVYFICNLSRLNMQLLR